MRPGCARFFESWSDCIAGSTSRERREQVLGAITGWSNLVFLFLVLSVYLWIPRRWGWKYIRPLLTLNRSARGRARDFNWHHVVGFWASIPLALVVASATVISFPWATDLAYRIAGDQPPQRSVGRLSPATSVRRPFAVESLNGLVECASDKVEGWRTITVTLPMSSDAPVQLRIDKGCGGGRSVTRFVSRPSREERSSSKSSRTNRLGAGCGPSSGSHTRGSTSEWWGNPLRGWRLSSQRFWSGLGSPLPGGAWRAPS